VLKECAAMKTATARDLTTRLPTILAWLEAGEEVVLKPDLCSETQSLAAEPAVNWGESAALQRDRTGEPVLSAQELDDLFEEMGSRY